MDILYNSGEPKNPFLPKKPLYILILIISDTGFCEIGFSLHFFIDAFFLLLMHFSLTDFLSYFFLHFFDLLSLIPFILLFSLFVIKYNLPAE